MRYRLVLMFLAVLLGLDVGVSVATLSETSRAIEAIRERVAYVQLVLPDTTHEYIVALAVNSYVVGHITAPAYGYLNEIEHTSLPVTAEQILRTGAGICGEAATAAQTLYNALGIGSRRVLAWYDLPDGTLAGHTTIEVYYGDAWHWFDPTWGVFYEGDTVYSLLEVLQLSPEARETAYVGNDSLLWMRAVRESGVVDAPLAFLGFPSLRIETEGQVLFTRTGQWDAEAASPFD